jgi:ABC-type multidrug transport system fused ATPase/permease subunit
MPRPFAGGRKVLAHEISLGSLFAMVWYFTFLDMPVRRLVGLNHEFQSALAASAAVFELLDMPVPEQSAGKDFEIKGQVVFENVQFGYEPGTSVLSKLHLSVFPGECVALVGPSGTGKSTFLNLIARLYPVVSGSILIDGEDINQISLESLRRQIGVVF